MGDVAMCAPVLATLCHRYPEVDFDMLSTPFFEPFFEQMPNFHFVGTNIKKEKGLLAIWRLYHKLTSEQKYDKVIDLHDVLRTKVLRTLFKMGGTPTFKINKGRSDRKRLTRAKNKERIQLKHTINKYTDVLAEAALPVVMREAAERRRLPMPIIDGLPQKEKNAWIGVSPFAQHQGKIYPIDKMRKVVETLCKYEGVRVLVFGGGAREKAVAEEWSESIRHCHSMVGKMKLSEELALISNLDCMVSMDSSAMHMASLYGVRVVSVWGATHPLAGFMGYGQKEEDAVQKDMPCRPCSIYGNKPCALGGYPCMDIDPEEIVERTMERLTI